MSKTSKSLPSNFKQKQIESADRSSSLSSSDILINNTSSVPSSVKKPSPLRFNSTDCINDSSTATSDKSWMTKRWSTVSGSLVMKRRHQKLAAKKLWVNRQKRRTYPPSKDIVKLEEKTSQQIYIHHNNSKKRLSSKQSLHDILSTFYNQGESVSSSTSSFKIGKILKKVGKQPYRKRPRSLVANNENQLFQPPPTISSTKSSTSTPLEFPTPPKRFSALAGKRGKVDYHSPKPKKISIRFEFTAAWNSPRTAYRREIR